MPEFSVGTKVAKQFEAKNGELAWFEGDVVEIFVDGPEPLYRGKEDIEEEEIREWVLAYVHNSDATSGISQPSSTAPPLHLQRRSELPL